MLPDDTFNCTLDLRWEDVSPQKMMNLKPINWDETSSVEKQEIILYKNQNITFACSTNTAYFAIGTQMAIGFKNGTEQRVNGNYLLRIQNMICVFYSKTLLYA